MLAEFGAMTASGEHSKESRGGKNHEEKTTKGKKLMKEQEIKKQKEKAREEWVFGGIRQNQARVCKAGSGESSGEILW